MDTAWVLILLGAPGSGKGTQACQLSKTLGLPQISTGDILRKAVEARTPLGELAKRLMDAGDLVPDDVMCGIVDQRIAMMDCQRGFILDGFPRTIEQASFLDLFLKPRSQWKLAAFNIWVDQDLLRKRTLGRRLCPACGELYNIYLNPPRIEGFCDKDGEMLISRPDDNEETHRRRQIAYAEESAALIDHYRTRDLLYDVDGNWERGVVSAQIYVALGCLLHEVSPAFDRTLQWSKSRNDQGLCPSPGKIRSGKIAPTGAPPLKIPPAWARPTEPKEVGDNFDSATVVATFGESEKEPQPDEFCKPPAKPRETVNDGPEENNDNETQPRADGVQKQAGWDLAQQPAQLQGEEDVKVLGVGK